MREREGYKPEQVRNAALQSVLDELNERQRAVYKVIIKWQPISNEKIAEHLHLKDHQVTPRVLELREMGVVEWAGRGISQTSGRTVSLWKINPNGKQLTLF